MEDAPIPPDAALPEAIMWQGRFITAKTRGRWEYVSRARDIKAAVILAIDGMGADRAVLLVEQFRVPLGRPCLELPAGLIGDDPGGAGETAATAAVRELEEETGYRATHLHELGEFCSSPGMVSESFTLFAARGLTRVGPGGGEPGEGIVVHRVALARLSAFVDARRAAGVAIDVRLLMLLAGRILEAFA